MTQHDPMAERRVRAVTSGTDCRRNQVRELRYRHTVDQRCAAAGGLSRAPARVHLLSNRS